MQSSFVIVTNQPCAIILASLQAMTFLSILKETFKLFLKNGRIFSTIALFTLLINSISYLLNIYTITPVMTDMFIEASLLNITKPDSPEFMQIITQMKKDARFILGFELIYVIINSIFVLLTITATILTAAITYAGKDELSLKDLVFRTWKTWLRPLVTWLYTSLFGLIFFFILGAILVFVSLWTKNNPSKIIYYGAPLVIIAMVYYMYLSVNWILGIVVSAIEKKRGIEAIRKAGEMIKGMKKQGFMLNVLINVVVGVLQFGFQMMPVKSSGFVVAKGVVVVCLSSLVSMFCFGGYVVIYYMCKKNHGERVELEGGDFSSGYVKVPTTPPVVDEKLP